MRKLVSAWKSQIASSRSARNSICEKRVKIGDRRTFLSLFFSAVSSLPALAACRFSCFAVNYLRSVCRPPLWGSQTQWADFEIEKSLLKAGHFGNEYSERGFVTGKGLIVLSVSMWFRSLQRVMVPLRVSPMMLRLEPLLSSWLGDTSTSPHQSPHTSYGPNWDLGYEPL